jgi:Xaa-Pro aminopeptidase
MNIRLQNLRQILKQHELDAALISSVPNIIYLTGITHFSKEEREAFVLITQTNQYIFTDARYTHAVRQLAADFTLKEIGHEHSFTQLLKEISDEEQITILGIETNNLTVFEHERILKALSNTKNNPVVIPANAGIQKIKKTSPFSYKHFDLTELRIKKDLQEINKIQKACAFGDKTFEFIHKKLKLGMTEKQVAFEMETFMRQHGYEPSFPTIVAFEENAAIPHHKTSDKKLTEDNIILLDFGVKYEEYCSDMTRTILFGNPSPEKKRVYQTVYEAQQKAIKYIEKQLEKNQDILAEKADEAARAHILGVGFPSIPHALGHGIGLEVHEPPTLSPKSSAKLEDGMVFSIEPGIYLNDVFGVRIEDLFALQNGNLIQLTNAGK